MWRLTSSTSYWPAKNDLCIVQCAMTPSRRPGKCSPSTTSSPLHRLSPVCSHVQTRRPCTTVLTWPNRCTIHLTPSNPGRSALFGVCCEAIPRQINYLIDEAMDVGKGSNAIVSMLHHFFDMHGLGEVHVHLHTYNCVGQNKNNMMIQYLCCRVLCGLHSTVTLSFMVVGHTKFSPDWCFGLLKQRYFRSRVGCLDDVVKVVEESATCNTAQLAGTQDGQTVVTTYDWAAMLWQHLRKFKGVQKFRHICFNSSTPGVVHVRHEAEGVETTLDLSLDPNWAPSSRVLPHLLPPSGLSFERRTYLYEKIREFVSEELRDVVCRRPEHTTTTTITPGLPEEEEDQPLCGKCRQPGHTARTFTAPCTL